MSLVSKFRTFVMQFRVSRQPLALETRSNRILERFCFQRLRTPPENLSLGPPAASESAILPEEKIAIVRASELPVHGIRLSFH